MKTCAQCHESKDVLAFSRQKKSKDGYQCYCKECYAAIARERRRTKAGQEYQHRRYIEMKKQGYFQSERWHELHNKVSRQWRKRTRGKQTRSNWNIANAEKVVEYNRRYASSAKGRENLKRGKIRRKTALANSDITFTAAEWQECLSAWGNCCAYCHRSDIELTQDHVIPLSRGGKHDKDNIVPACRQCNSSKGNKLLAPDVTT